MNYAVCFVTPNGTIKYLSGVKTAPVDFTYDALICRTRAMAEELKAKRIEVTHTDVYEIVELSA